jgi:phosphatidyl-myo-inositol dimannoside synthase
MRAFYLTPGCFDKGGISRYSRYQIRVLRELFGQENVFVFSVLGPGDEDFEEPFDVTYYAGGATSSKQRISYISRVYAAALSIRPDLILTAHLNLSGAAKLLSKVVGARTVLNIYGAEAWSKMRRDAAWGLRTTDHVISDCHFTARYLEDNNWRPRGSVPVAWDCVELDRFFPSRPDRSTLERYGVPDPEMAFNILTLGRMGPDTAYKGYERLLEAFSMIADQVPNARLIYAGRGEMVGRLRQKAEQKGLEQRVHISFHL